MAFISRTLCIVFLAMFVAALPKAAEAQVTFAKSFSPDTIPAGGTSVLTFTIANTFAGGGVSDLAFTDNLPAAITLANPANAINGCFEGTLTAADGGSSIGYSGGRLAAGDSCTLSVVVTSSTIGTHNNTTSILTSDSGSAPAATDDLTVDATLPGFSKSAAPNPSNVNDPFTVTYTVDNTANATAIGSLSFSETFPLGVTVAPIPNASTTCISSAAPPTLTAAPGSSSLDFRSNGFNFSGFQALLAGASCTFSVDLVASGFGSFALVSGDLFADSANVGVSRTTVVVNAPATDGPTLIKRFEPGASGPGGTVQLVFEIINAGRDNVTNIAFTDDLDAFLTGAVSTSGSVSGCGGTISGTGALSFTGGSLASGANCSFTVDVDVPGTATASTYTNTTSALTATVNGAPFSGAAATDTLEISAGTPLDLDISFLTNPVESGGSTTMRYTITNPNPTVGAADVAFSQSFVGFGALTASATPGADSCGTGSTASFVPAFNPPPPSDATPAQLTLTGGSLAPGGSCSFDLALNIPSDLGGGSYPTQTSFVTSDAGTGSSGSDTLTVNGGVSLSFDKAFTGGPVNAGDTTTLEFTITSAPESTATATGLAFSDDLEAMLTGTLVTGATTNTCGGMATGGFPTSNFGYSGGSIAPGSNCTISLTVQVPGGAMTGDYVNTSSALSGTAGGNAVAAPAATATLNVLGPDDQPVILSKEFIGGPFLPGEIATLRFTIENPNASNDATSIVFTDSLSAALTGLSTTGALPATPCGAGSSISGTSFLTFVGGSLTVGSPICSFDVNVLIPAGASSGSYTGTTSNVTATVGGNGTVGDPALGTFVVETALLEITKTFTDDPVIAGNLATMEITVTNPTGSLLTTASYNDDLSAMLPAATATTIVSLGCSGGSSVVGPGSSNLAVTITNLPAGQFCTYRFAVSVPADVLSGSYDNTVSDLVGVINGATVTGGVATDSLVVTAADAPGFSKMFSTATVSPNQTTDLIFTITNTNTGPVTDLSFNDDLDAMLSGAVATGLPISGCGGTLSGTSFLTFTDGALAGSESCMLTATIQVPATATAGAYTNITSDLAQNGLAVTPAATAVLTVEPAAAPGFVKAFTPASIDQGATSVLSFTIDNTANSIEAANLAFSDNFPAGMQLAAVPAVSNSCGGSVTANAGNSSMSLSGGQVDAATSCVVEVTVQGLAAGSLVNTSSDLTSTLPTATAASATLTVNALPLNVSMSFVPSTIEQFLTSTLTYTLTNLSPIDATNVTLNDTLPAGVVIASPANANTTCRDGTLTAPDGGTAVSYTGGTAPAAASCTVSVSVTSGVVGSYPNSTETVSSSLGTSAAANATLTVDPSSTGTITIVQNTDTDGPFEFTSNASELNFTINTAGGTGQYGPVAVPAGSYQINQLAPDGVGSSSISCTDSDSVGNARAGTLTVNIAVLEAVTCTFTSVSSRQKTVDSINRFLTKRADLILSSEPSNSRRIDRLKRGAGNASALRFSNGDLQSFLPFTAQISTASETYSMSTSLLQIRQAAATMALGHGDQNGVRHVPNYRWDAWFEAQYKKFESGADTGHFAIAYFGADYLVNPDLLIGALLQIDDMEDKSSSLNSTVNGTGWMAGPYITARIGPNLYFDGRIATGTSSNDISPFNTYEDEFSTSRWMAMAGLTGDFQRGNWTIQPGASLSYFEEKQNAYVDGVGVTIPSQVVSLGQIKIGPTFTGQFVTAEGMNYSPFFSIDAIYNFGDTKGVITTNPDTASTDGWRGRIQTGVDFSLQNGTQLSLGGSYDGIGRGSLDIWGLSFELNIPIQKAKVK